MRKVTVGLAVLILLTLAQAVGLAQISQFDGDWRNVDAATSGITKLKIDVAGTEVKVQAFGKCHPTDCDWGTVVAYAYSPNVSANPVTTARAVSAIYSTGFSQTILILTPAPGGRLRADAYTRFTDHSGRSAYNATYIFAEVQHPADCLPYNPLDLRIVDEGASGWLLTDGHSRMLVLDDKADAERALALAKRHTSHCFIGRDNHRPNRREYVHEYWLGDSGIATTISGEDCIAYNPLTLRIVDEGASGWLLTDGHSRMMILDNRDDAEAALNLARRYTNQCFIGRDNHRPNRREYIVEYWK